MKDPRGHGSNPNAGNRPLANTLAAISANRKSMFGYQAGFRAPIKTNPVNDHPKAAPVPVHDGAQGVGPNDPRAGSRDYDAFGRPRADKSGYDNYGRDLAYRSRQGNGGIGSGGRD